VESKKITVPKMRLQLEWHQLREQEIDGISVITTLDHRRSTLVEHVSAAIKCWNARVDAEGVPLLGLVIYRPEDNNQGQEFVPILDISKFEDPTFKITHEKLDAQLRWHRAQELERNITRVNTISTWIIPTQEVGED
jgi:hypothetical protein